MIAAGFGRLKSIRSALLTGYTTLLAGWLLWPSVTREANFSESASQLAQRAINSDLGSGTKLALVSFVATFVGTAVNTLITDRAINWIEKVFPGPWWELYLGQGFDASLYSNHFQLSTSDSKSLYVPNPHASERGERSYPIDVSHPVLSGDWLDRFRWSTYEERLSERQEARFRLHVLLSALVLAIPLGIAGGNEWWFVSVAVVMIAVVELAVHNKRVSDVMTSKEFERLLKLKSDAVTKVETIEAELAVSEDDYVQRKKPYSVTGSPSYDEFIATQRESLKQAKAAVVDVEKQIEIVEDHKFLKKNPKQITEI